MSMEYEEKKQKRVAPIENLLNSSLLNLSIGLNANLKLIFLLSLEILLKYKKRFLGNFFFISIGPITT